MGTARVPAALLQKVKLIAKVTRLSSKGGRYTYYYVHIPAALRHLVEGKRFKPEIKGNIIIFRASDEPTAYKVVKRKTALYIRLPLEKIDSEYVIIEPVLDGFIVVLG